MDTGRSVTTIQPNLAERCEPFPLTDIQLAYWLGRTSGFALGGACHVYWEFTAGPERDPNRLEAALNRLIGLHDMLRAVVQPDGTQRVLSFDRQIETDIYNHLPHVMPQVLASGPMPFPVGFIGGRQSKEVRKVGLGLTRRITQGRIQMDDGSHLFPMESPLETAALVDEWLKAGLAMPPH